MSALLLIPFLLAQPKDAVFDLPALLAPPLNVRILKTTEKAGIVTEEVRFFSEKHGDKVVDIFALFSYPKDAKNLPAFIWNQGGLYQATPHFTELATALDVPMERGRELVHELMAITPGWVHPGTDYIASFPPFNNQPTQYRISVDGRPSWFGQ